MAFQRAQWHSGLTYRQTCRSCQNVVTYQDDKLDFRPWYADGFVYCPTCRTPLRHSETYAIDGPKAQTSDAPVAEVPQVVEAAQEAPAAPVSTEGAVFCTQCGKKANPGDRFCAGCGNKLT